MKKILLILSILFISLSLVSCKDKKYDAKILEQELNGNTYTFKLEIYEIDRDKIEVIAQSSAVNIYDKLDEKIGTKTRYLNITFVNQNKDILTVKYIINQNEFNLGLKLLNKTWHN
jgi:uncharacterized membrane protein YciS (DUF1049 family)